MGPRVNLTPDQIPDIPVDEKVAYLSGISYRDFLSKHLKITEPEVFVLLQDLMGETGVGPEAVSAYTAIMYAGLPGRKTAGLPCPLTAPLFLTPPTTNGPVPQPPRWAWIST